MTKFDVGKTTISYLQEATEAIQQKHSHLGGDNGFLGKATEGVQFAGLDYYQHFQNGVIYWSYKTGAYEVHGAILAKWTELGRHKGLLGFPTTDEQVCPDGIGRYNHFVRGSIYWTPQTGAHEIHGAIRERWAQMGWERSPLGYPITDELAAVPGPGKFSDFQHGRIGWNETIGIDVRVDEPEGPPIVIRYTGLICFGETDEWSGSDEIFLTTTSSTIVKGNVQVHTELHPAGDGFYGDVDQGGSFPGPIAPCYAGLARPVSLIVNLMEQDEGSPNAYKEEIAGAVTTAAGAVGGAVGGPLGAVIGVAGTKPIADLIARGIGGALGLGDDLISQVVVTFDKQELMHMLSRPTMNEQGVRYHFFTYHTGQGATYKCYFDVVSG